MMSIYAVYIQWWDMYDVNLCCIYIYSGGICMMLIYAVYLQRWDMYDVNLCCMYIAVGYV